MKARGQKNRTYSVIIISDATSSSKTFSVSAKLVHRSVASALLFFLFFGFMLFHYLTINFDKQKMNKLSREKRENQLKMTDMTNTISDLQKRLEQMEVRYQKIAVQTGIISYDQLPQVGQGGPLTEEAAASLSQQLPGGPSHPTEGLGMKQLTEKARSLESNFEMALSFINAQNLRYAATPSIAPTRGYLSSTFQYRTNPFTMTKEFHAGIDVATQLGQKVITPADGVVIVAENRGGFGQMIIIDHGFGYTTQYAHLSKFAVRVGEKVKRRDVIGYVGSTGMSTAPHLHYEVHYLGKPVNPFYFILDWGKE